MKCQRDGTARGLASGVLGGAPLHRSCEISRRRQHGEKKDRPDVGENRLRMRISISNLRAAKKEPSQDGWAFASESSGAS